MRKIWFAFFLASLGLSSCVSVTRQNKSQTILDASQEGEVEGTGTSSADIRSMAERMAREIASLNWSKELSQVRIAITDVDNQTRFPIDPNVIKDRLLADLVEFSQKNKVLFTEKLTGADFFLKTRITALSKGSSAGANDYLLYSFKLIDQNETVVWMKTYETKKQGNVGVIYR